MKWLPTFYKTGYIALCLAISACKETPSPLLEQNITLPPTLQPSSVHEGAADESDGELLNASKPDITNIQFPDSILSGSEYGNGIVTFQDPEGDIHSVQFTLVEGGCMEFEYFAFDPMAFISSGDRYLGKFQFQQTCIKCTESDGDVLMMQVQLFDRAAHASEPFFYAFTCQ